MAAEEEGRGAAPTVPIVNVLPLPVCRGGGGGGGECDAVVLHGALLPLPLHLPISKHRRIVSCAIVSTPHPTHHTPCVMERHL